jgi:hypothetical protein
MWTGLVMLPSFNHQRPGHGQFGDLSPLEILRRHLAQIFVTMLALNTISGDVIAGKDLLMLWTIFVVLLILWLLGMVSSYTLGGFIHILLVIALVMLIISLFSGRRLA